MPKKIEKMSHQSETNRKMSQHMAKSAAPRSPSRSTVALPPLELPPAQRNMPPALIRNVQRGLRES